MTSREEGNNPRAVGLNPRATTNRPRDAVWDSLDEHFGAVTNDAERARRNAAVRLLKQSEATPEGIKVAYDWCSKTFPSLTEMAIAMHYSRAQHEAATPRVSRLAIVMRMAEGPDR